MVIKKSLKAKSINLWNRPALTNNGCCAKEEDEEGVNMDKESF